jgi:hypothetical protein
VDLHQLFEGSHGDRNLLTVATDDFFCLFPHGFFSSVFGFPLTDFDFGANRGQLITENDPFLFDFVLLVEKQNNLIKI